jgi:diguanylate cyclase (GGDEF)-like protein
LFVSYGTDDDADLAEMADEPVGVVATTFDHEFIETHFPQVNLRTYPNARELVEAAIRGEIEAFVADYPTGHYHLLLLDAINEFRSVDTLYTEGIHVAVKKGATELLAFLEAGFDKITKAEIDAIRDRWLIPSEPIPRWILLAAITTGASLFLIALGAHYLSLRRTVHRRTLDLNATIRKLEVANGKLQHLAQVDPLTKIHNRQAFFDQADQEIERAKRYARPLSLALFDLDYFKQVNDRFGHLAGDTVLKGFADAMRAKLRETDLFARLGGDEFIALLPETPHDEAVLLARRLLRELRDERINHENEVIDLSFSAGVAEFKDDRSIEDWIRRADMQLYRSKAEGRAQVIGTERGPRPGPEPFQA